MTIDMECSDFLGDTSDFTLCYAGASQKIDKRGLAMVDMPHDSNDGWLLLIDYLSFLSFGHLHPIYDAQYPQFFLIDEVVFGVEQLHPQWIFIDL